MFIYTPNNLLYPIRITKILCKTNDEVKRNQTIFNYEYTSKVHESTAEDPEGREVERTWPATFESELEGKVKNVTIKPGQILTRRTAVADVEEPCKHEVQYGGICAICGTDVTTITNYNSTISTKDRAHINTVHGNTALLISQSEANKADDKAKKRLVDARKLILVVDLDQTIIHATVDPTVAEWQQDPSNPNHDAVKDVRAFHLADDVPSRGCWYYIKLRPGLAEFLETISKIYELHIYTMGTRAYAENIAKIIDPDRKMFADRILSRDESGSMTHKQLKRLFPVDSKMVVIIDDRGDVWQWSPNLVKVSVYDFFIGIGDINGRFLPKRPELEAKSTKTSNPDTVSNGTKTNGEVSPVDQLVSMAGDQDAASIKEKVEEQDSALATQLVERPLLQKQKILDAAEDETKTSPAAEAAAELLLTNDATDSFEHPRYRHNLLQDDDTELKYLTQSLQSIHTGFYDSLDRESSDRNGRSPDLRNLPDAANIMRSLKERVLAGTQLVFSGVVPLGTELSAFDTVIWAQTFGARVSPNITTRTTHVVASPERRTAKVRQAARKGGRIKIVSVGWLMACFSQWRKVSEEPYLVHTDASRREELIGGLPDSFGDDDKMALSSSEEGDLVTEDEVDYTRTPLRDDDTDDQAAEEELAKYAPQLTREGSSPLDTEDVEHWDDIDAELADFMGSEDDDSDLESIRSNNSTNEVANGKRKRSDDGDFSDLEGSKLQKRKKEASARTSNLATVTTASTLPQDSVANGMQEMEVNDDLEAALEAGLLGD